MKDGLNYFLDTEFVDDGETISLISIGIVCEDGREYYAINALMNLENSSWFVTDRVVPLLERDSKLWKTVTRIAAEVEMFLGVQNVDFRNGVMASEAHHYTKVGKPKIWADYASYDWVVLCQLYGAMKDLPKGMRHRPYELDQYLEETYTDRKLIVRPPEEPEHHALYDARWVKRAWEKANEHEKAFREATGFPKDYQVQFNNTFNDLAKRTYVGPVGDIVGRVTDLFGDEAEQELLNSVLVEEANARAPAHSGRMLPMENQPGIINQQPKHTWICAKCYGTNHTYEGLKSVCSCTDL